MLGRQPGAHPATLKLYPAARRDVRGEGTMHRPEVKYPLWIDTQSLPTSKKQLDEPTKSIREHRYLHLATVALRSDKQRKKKLRHAA
jgi:hypothetical protein